MMFKQKNEETISYPFWFWSVPITVITILSLVALIVTGCAILQELQVVAQEPVVTPSSPVIPVSRPSIQILPEEGIPGISIAVLGEGWQPGDTVMVSLDDPTDTQGPVASYATALVTDEGAFAVTFRYPRQTPWAELSHAYILVQSPLTAQSASATFRVLATTEPASPTPTPTGEPTSPPATGVSPTAAPLQATITAGALNMRTGPGTQYPAITALPGGTTVTVLAQNQAGNWLKVRLPDGSEGWLSKAYTNFGGLAPVSAESPPPTSTPTPTPTATPTPAPPAVITHWRGEYFGNRTLSGSPVLVRNDVDINFGWGDGSPAAGLPANNFSARWTRDLYFDNSLYRFHIWVDDGARLYVDNSLILDAWYDGGAREVTVERTMWAGYHQVRLEYYERTGQTAIHLWWERISDTSFPDWKAEYFDNRRLRGDPVLTRNETDIDHDWGEGAPASGLPADNFSARWTDRVSFDDGLYRFKVKADDGIRLWLDGDRIINDWRDGSARWIEQDVVLEDDRYDVKVEYYEHYGDAEIEVVWERIGDAINQVPKAIITGPTSAGEGASVTFSGSQSYDPDGSIILYEWDTNYSGDFTLDAVGPTVNTSFPDGPANINVALRVTDNDEDRNVTAILVTVQNQPPQAEAGGPYSGQVGQLITLSGTASDPGAFDQPMLTYRWDFGDGSHANGSTVSHSYAQPGHYTVKLTATDKDGAQDVDTADVHVLPLPNQAPAAVINGPTRGLVNESLTFNGSSSSDPDGVILGYTWDFGDGTTAGGVSVSHTYSTPGNYNVVLTVTDDSGLSDNSTYTILIEAVVTNQPPVANIHGPASALTGETVIFDSGGSHDPDGTITGYIWDFGDGNRARASRVDGSVMAHVYNAAGTYQVRLTVTDDGGLSATATHTIVIQDPAPNRPPVAQINGPARVLVGETAIFDSGGSHDPDGVIVSYVWDFGDGNQARSSQPADSTVAHTYNSAGTYQVSLTVTDDGGLSATANHTIVVEEVIPNQPPVAAIIGPDSALVGETVIFDSGNSHDPDGAIVSYVWDFGDGKPSRAVNSGASTVAHTYNTAGAYQVSLTVTDDGGLSAMATHIIVIEGIAPNQPPQAVINGPTTAAAGQMVSFDGSSSSDPDGTIASYAWDFGDGATASGENVTHQYNSAGQYNVALIVTDDGGSSDRSTYTILVEALSRQRITE
jgi:PKD repeat protein